jgi:allantoin racemase
MSQDGDRGGLVMRLFYQSFGVSRGSRDGAYGQVLKRIVDRAAAPGTEVSINGLSPHHAIAEQYRHLEFLDTAEVLKNGLRAESEGYDAFLLGNIFDPGLHELRELLNIPVLGLRESSVHVACLMGRRFR